MVKLCLTTYHYDEFHVDVGWQINTMPIVKYRCEGKKILQPQSTSQGRDNAAGGYKFLVPSLLIKLSSNVKGSVDTNSM